MPLQTGDRLAEFEIESLIGSGGMGEVYRAHDRTLGRKVAIKVLPAELSKDEELLARFEREARLLASLTHPNVAAIHGLGESEGIRFLVMELVPGETLEERLYEGPLPVEEILPLFRSITEGLAAAHERGIVHRDLKPANVKVTPDGKPKILDFGLARAFDDEASASMLSRSPTITRDTRHGVILGTAAYMSPEQARGQRVDKRTDVWAFGCVLYEALTGVNAFVGDTVTDMLAAVVKTKPDWSALPRGTPHKLRELLERCLQKDATRRLRDIGDAGLVLDELMRESVEGPGIELAPAPPRGGARGSRLAPFVIAMTVLAGVALWGWMRPAPPAPVTRFGIPLEGPRTTLYSIHPAITNDGSRIVYARDGASLVLRDRDQLETRIVPETEEVRDPFFSPDGTRLAYFTGNPGALRVMDLSGGRMLTLVEDSAYASGGAWGDDGWIYFLGGSSEEVSLERMRVDGPERELLATPDRSQRELYFRWPEVLPGGRKILVTVWRDSGGADVAALDVSTGERTELSRGLRALYASTGHLVVFGGDGVVRAAPFDATNAAVTGPFEAVLDGVWPGIIGGLPVALSASGTLVYLSDPRIDRVVRVDREGTVTPVDADWSGRFGSLALSPDGLRLAVTIEREGVGELWVKSMEDGPLSRLSVDGTFSNRPWWMPDGRALLFISDRTGKSSIYRVPADGSAEPEPWFDDPRPLDEAVLSQDGAWLIARVGAGGGRDIHGSRFDRDSGLVPLVATGSEEYAPIVSPDGRFLAYVSDETGRPEVYVRPFPNVETARWQVSSTGGTEPLWSRSGNELFYRSLDEELIAIAVVDGSAFQSSRRSTLFSTRDFRNDRNHRRYTVSPDDQSFLFVQSSVENETPQLVVVVNWLEELERLVPVEN